MKAEQGHLIRSVGLWGLAAMVFNGMVGAGVFGFPGAVSQTAGSWAPLVVLTVGLGLLPVVLAMVALSRLFDATGGPVAYTREAFGPNVGFQVGWMACLSSCASIAANANLLADYAFAGHPALNTPLLHTAVVLAALAVVGGVNLMSAGRSAGVLRIISVAKLAPLLWLLVLAFPALLAQPAAKAAAHWQPAQAALLAAYAFIGFEGALTPAGEARDPKRDLPVAVLIVFLAVVALYAALTWAYVAVGYDAHAADKAPLARMGELLAGPVGLSVVLGAAVLSILGNIVSVGVFTSRRLVALEEQGSLPRWFGAVSPSNGVPRNAVLFMTAVLVALALGGGFVALAVLSVASRMLVYLASMAALPAIRARRGLPRFQMSDLMILPGVPVCLYLLSQSKPAAWTGLAIALAAGLVVLLAARRLRLLLDARVAV